MTHRLQTDDGANAVEFALVLPILVMLVFGIFTVGMSYNAKLAMANGVRDASRFGATLPEPDENTDGTTDEKWLRLIAGRAIGAANGQLGRVTSGTWTDADPAEHELCVALLYTVNPEDPSDTDGLSRQMHWIPDSAPTFTEGDVASTRCFDDGFPDDEPRVQVFARAPARVDIVFFRRDLSLTNTAVAHWEPAE